MDGKNRMDELRDVSGEVSYSDPLTVFLYLLMRNELAAGKVEALVREAVESSEETSFTNGWLAHYANNLAIEIAEAKVTGLKKALEKAFVAVEKEKIEEYYKEKSEKEENFAQAAEGVFGDTALLELEEKLISMAGVSSVESGTGNPIDMTTEEAVDNAMVTVRELVRKGHMSKEDAENIKSDIDVVVDEETTGKTRVNAEEVVKEHTDETKWTVERAESVVNKALKAHDSVSRTVTKPEVDEAVAVKDTAHSVDTVDANDVEKENQEKWKKTNEELKKITEEVTDQEPETKEE